MDDLLNSPFVNKLLRFAMSKMGGLTIVAATWLATHVVSWLGLPLVMSPEQLEQIRDGIEVGANTLFAALLAAFYAWVASRMKRGTKALQVIHNDVARAYGRPQIEVSGVPGNRTVYAVAKASGVSPASAVADAAKL
jgi:hypothetical protein